VYTGQIVWDLLDLSSLVTLIAVSIAAARGRAIVSSDWRAALIALAPLCFLLFPVRSTLALGQINLVLVLMIVTDLTLGVSCRGRRLPTGLLVGLAAAVKLTPLIFIPFLLAARQWRAARTALCSFAVATAGAFVINPSASWLYFTNDAFDTKRVGNVDKIGNQTLHAAVVRAHLPLTSLGAEVAIAVVLCAGVATAAAAYRHSSALLGTLVCAATGLLVSPISWLHHYVWVVPALVWLLVGADRPAKGEWWALAGASAFVVIPPITAGGTGLLWYLRDDAYVVTTLLFISLVAVMLVVRSRRAALTPRVSRRSTSSGASDVPDAPGVRTGSLV
jgi:alpha-1,2-mannosyltransferase